MEVLTPATTNTPAVKILGAELLRDFYAFLDVSPKTLSTYQRAMRQVFRYFTENGITQPAHQDIVDFKKTLEGRNLKAATIALYLAACRRFFDWTEQAGIFPNVARGIKAPRQDKGHKRDYFGATQLKGIMQGMSRENLQGKRDYAIFALMATCGLRTIEISRANIEDFRTLGDCTVLYVQGKGRKDRAEFVKIPEPLMLAINDYLTLRGNAPDDAPLFAGIGNRNHNGRMCTRTISQIAKRAMRAAGYNSRRLSAHSLRHSAVTLSLLAGQSLAEVQSFARHTNIATTQIYSHAVERIRSQCEASIAAQIF